MGKDDHGSTFTDARRSACTYVYIYIMGVHRSMFPYISTKGTVMHGFTSTDDYTVKTVVLGRMKVYD